MERCSGCRAAFYCDKVCQKNDWKTHKPRCKMAQSNRADEIGTGVGKRFVKYVDNWRKGSAVVFGRLAKAAMTMERVDSHILLLHSKYDASAPTELVLGSSNGEQFEKPKIQIEKYEVVALSDLPAQI